MQPDPSEEDVILHFLRRANERFDALSKRESNLATLGAGLNKEAKAEIRQQKIELMREIERLLAKWESLDA